MSRLPADVTDVQQTPEGYEGRVSLPVGEHGYFGRGCPQCDGLFMMRADEYKALPEEDVLTCPYCGHRDEHSEFMTKEQVERATAAAHATAEQFLHDKVEEMFSGIFGQSQRRPRGGSGVSITYTPGTPPPVRSLPTYVEAGARRTIRCESCSNHYAVYGASAFCPVCGPRAALSTVIDSIEAARRTLSPEDAIEPEQREELRAAGVFDGMTSDAIKMIVTLFEVYAADRFAAKIAGHEQLLKGKGNVFQRLDDADALFCAHTGQSLQGLVDDACFERLRQAFEQRHVLVHRHGKVDQRFLDRVPGSTLRVGQRLLISRRNAEQVLDDLEALVRVLDAA